MEELLNAVLANPADDAPRLIMADWWEEHDNPERAEFVRAQIRIADIQRELKSENLCADPDCSACEEIRVLQARTEELWAVHGCNWIDDDALEHFGVPANHVPAKFEYVRGFVGVIRGPVREWLGDSNCGVCGSVGLENRTEECEACFNLKPYVGIAKVVCSKWPVTRVEFTDIAPWPQTTGKYMWWKMIMTTTRTVGPPYAGDVPDLLFNRMVKVYSQFLVNEKNDPYCPVAFRLNSRVEADMILSNVAVDYGRELAGLKPIYQVNDGPALPGNSGKPV